MNKNITQLIDSNLKEINSIYSHKNLFYSFSINISFKQFDSMTKDNI